MYAVASVVFDEAEVVGCLSLLNGGEFEVAWDAERALFVQGQDGGEFRHESLDLGLYAFDGSVAVIVTLGGEGVEGLDARVTCGTGSDVIHVVARVFGGSGVPGRLERMPRDAVLSEFAFARRPGLVAVDAALAGHEDVHGGSDILAVRDPAGAGEHVSLRAAVRASMAR